jgi:hypothetical protein
MLIWQSVICIGNQKNKKLIDDNIQINRLCN